MRAAPRPPVAAARLGASRVVGVDTDEVAAALTAVDGVVDVHDLHVWTITSGFESLTVHVTVEGRPHGEVLHEIRDLIRRRFGIEHSTVQLERPDDCAGGSCE